MKIKLTPLQLDFITHRLAVWDAIGECFTDHHPDDLPDAKYLPEHKQQIEHAAIDLMEKIESSKALFISEYSDIEKDVLIDCFEGNTWFAGLLSECNDQDNPQKFSASERSIDGLAAKLEQQGLSIGYIPKC